MNADRVDITGIQGEEFGLPAPAGLVIKPGFSNQPIPHQLFHQIVNGGKRQIHLGCDFRFR